MKVENETQGKHLLPNLERNNYDSNELNQISINRMWVMFLIFNHIILIFITAAFVVNKFLFIICFKYTQNIYTLF